MSGPALVVLVTVLTMVPQFSTDAFMPALPDLVSQLGTTPELGTVTITIFFIALALGMLVLGPISDSTGRKPVLIACGIAAAALSASCALATSIWYLIVVRVVHGFAAGGMTTVGMSLVKDCFSGRKMESMLAITQAMSFIAPTVAPLVGAAVLHFADWRGVFIAMTVAIVIALVGAIVMPETLPPDKRRKRQDGAMLGGLVQIARSRPHVSLTVVTCLLIAPFMGYLGIASFVFEDQFGVSELAFGVFFAVASILAATGPVVYMRTTGIRTQTLIVLALVVELASGACIVLFGGIHQLLFFCLLMPCLFMTTYIKPRIIGLLLDAELAEAGATSSAFNFTQNIFGCAAAFAMNALPGPFTGKLGGIIVIVCALALVALVTCRGAIHQAITPNGAGESGD